MLAFHNDPALKKKYVDRVEAHRLADSIVQGYGYWFDGKGCAVGCSIHGDDHAAYEELLGIPSAIAWAEDRIFEGLPVEEARHWPRRFFEAIQPGADLTGVPAAFALWILKSVRIRHDHGIEFRQTADLAADLLERRMAGDEPHRDDWEDAMSEDRWELINGVRNLDSYGMQILTEELLMNGVAGKAQIAAAKLLELLGAAPVLSGGNS